MPKRTKTGQYEFGETVLRPRGGFDYVFAPGAVVDVLSELSAFSKVGDLSLDGVCGFGGSIGIASIDDDQDQSYTFEFDGEWGNGFVLGKASASFSRKVCPSLFDSGVSMTTQHRVSVSATYGIDF